MSITSTWIQSAPAATTLRTSSPRRAKSADRMLGVMRVEADWVDMMFGVGEGIMCHYCSLRRGTGNGPVRRVRELRLLHREGL
ncbi:hypothetical protein D9M70_622980 [compost metagenome]